MLRTRSSESGESECGTRETGMLNEECGVMSEERGERGGAGSARKS